MSRGKKLREQKERRRRKAAEAPTPEFVARVGPEHISPGCLGIVVFGPGKGEAIVVRLPNRGLGVVDGCREPSRDKARGLGDPVRELLAAFAEHDGETVDTQRLRFVCLTHPHDDHYAGVGRLMAAYAGRIDHLWMPTDSDRYLRPLVQYLDRRRDRTTNLPDVEEVQGLERLIAQHDRLLEHAEPPLFRILSGGQIPIREHIDGKFFEVMLCSPDDADAHFARRHMIDAITALTDNERTSFPVPDPNVISGSLVIRWGKSRVLLAGDLLREEPSFRGWARARHHVNDRVQVVNVAHHASREAHDDELWRTMGPRLALVTPFQRASRNQPPRPDMIEHIARTSHVVITAPPNWSEEDLARFEWSNGRDDGRSSHVSLRNQSIVAQSAGGHEDRNNAVAVSLSHEGSILRIVLGGRAQIVKTRP